MTSIYLLTVFTSDGQRKRVWGWYPTWKEAELAIAQNRGSMHESLYDWLVMEEVQMGIGAGSRVCDWYTWEHELRCWGVAFQWSPEWADDVCNFGIG